MSAVPVQVVVTPSPQVAVEVAGAVPVTITAGIPGPPGPPGEALLAGYFFAPTQQLAPGDHVEFTGAAWTNVHKTTLSDGGNF